MPHRSGKTAIPAADQVVVRSNLMVSGCKWSMLQGHAAKGNRKSHVSRS